MDDTSRGNIPEFTVSEISGAIRRTLEGAFGRVRVRGEITEHRTYPSGHAYFALKDQDSKLRAVIWRNTMPRIGVKPENGVEVIASGRISSYAERSDYQIIVDRLDYAGEGALLARIEKLRLRLAEEGLFDEARKRPIPSLPALIGVVTSEKGAVIQDIRTTIARRFPRPILLWPVPVQGQGAAEQIAAAIEGMGALPLQGPVRRPDVLIVARGGGSLEDLMPFNEEVVLRAAAACPIPLISAVGHETDTTLIDFVSDRRAPTPTAAAEMAVPARIELLAAVQQRALRLTRAGQSVMDRARLRLTRAGARLPDLPAVLQSARQRLDDRTERLALAPRALLSAKRRALESAASRLPRPRETIAARRAELRLLAHRAASAARRVTDREARALARLPDPTASVKARLREGRAALRGLSARLDAASYEALLERGFVLVRDADGAPITRAADVAPGQRLSLQFADDTLRVTEDRGRRPAGPKGGPAKSQGSLL